MQYPIQCIDNEMPYIPILVSYATPSFFYTFHSETSHLREHRELGWLLASAEAGLWVAVWRNGGGQKFQKLPQRLLLPFYKFRRRHGWTRVGRRSGRSSEARRSVRSRGSEAWRSPTSIAVVRSQMVAKIGVGDHRNGRVRRLTVVARCRALHCMNQTNQQIASDIPDRNAKPYIFRRDKF
jgi:hypothetical protein